MRALTQLEHELFKVAYDLSFGFLDEDEDGNKSCRFCSYVQGQHGTLMDGKTLCPIVRLTRLMFDSGVRGERTRVEYEDQEDW
jgi:hypothetical protein